MVLHVTISSAVRTSNLADQNCMSVAVSIPSAHGRGNDAEKATYSNQRVWPEGREHLWRLPNGAALSRPLSAERIRLRFSCVLFLGLAWQQHKSTASFHNVDHLDIVSTRRIMQTNKLTYKRTDGHQAELENLSRITLWLYMKDIKFFFTQSSTAPRGGVWEYAHRSPASRRRRRKGKPVPGGITGPPCHWGI
jgi:hypothetical protein